VNQVSAPHLASDRGIAVRQLKTTTRGGRYANVVAVRVGVDNGVTLVAEGTLGADKGPQLTRWGDYDLSAELSGHALVLFNENKPGVIGAIGTILGRRNINVSRVQLGLNPRTNEAVSVWNVDSGLLPDVLDEIKRAPFVQRAVGLE
jgi:D-3-phosphoglycerate dehydrogenase / 2-oxoglutarate reductase